ncbi:hypothetical protein [Nocardiopsis xinjiangensis]|uniref:hypothetical protein n=1 Tax=Nocardiopsis xinjiangensis TaxID=124285 RepID=UPI00034A4AAB|nr:hypothetical protein [Nocardiopsis xinjiangensis]
MIGRRRNTRGEVPSWSIAFRPPDDTHAFQARVPTNAEGMWFDGSFEVIVSWNGASPVARARATARIQREVIRVATEVGARYCLGDRGTAEAEIACAVSDKQGFRDDAVRDVAVSVTLAADKDDLAIERERERVGPRNEVHKAIHRVRMQRVDELRRDVLSDPEVARVWWYEQNPEMLYEIEKAGEALDAMATTAEGATPAVGTGEGKADPILEAFVGGLDEEEKEAVLTRLTRMLEGLGRPDLAERLRQHWSPSPPG